MALDLKTISIVFAVITVSLCIMMAFIWRTNRTYPGFRFWVCANFSAAAGFVFLAGYGLLPDILTIIVANSFAFSSMLLCFIGNRKFLGLAGKWSFCLGLFSANTLSLIYFAYFNSPIFYRLISISLFLAIVSGRSALDFRRAGRDTGSHSYMFVSLTYLIFSLLMVGRATLIYLFWADSLNLIQSLSYIVFTVFAIAWTFTYLILNNDRLQRELRATKAEFEKLATTDFLTGISNNRRFFEVGEIEIQRARRFRHSLTLIMFDIDYFKRINDTYGHAAGDTVLIAVVDVCKFNLRELDTIGRLGGEEFGILLPHADINVAKMVAGRMRRAIEETEIALESKSVETTASFGVTELSENDKNLKDLLDRADSALYDAKQNGRNQVKIFVTPDHGASENLPGISSERIM